MHVAERAGSRNELIRRNLPLVEIVARRFARRGEPLEDLIQVGTIGLINAVDRYDPRRGTPLAALAVPYVTGEIQRHLRDRCATVRLPRGAVRRALDVRQADRELAERFGRSPRPVEIAAETGLDVGAVERALTAPAAAPLPEEGVPDVAGEDAYEAGEARVLVAAGSRGLDLRQRRILRLCFFEGLSQREIARELHLSQAHVARLLEGALRTMRVALDGEGAEAPGHALR